MSHDNTTPTTGNESEWQESGWPLVSRTTPSAMWPRPHLIVREMYHSPRFIWFNRSKVTVGRNDDENNIMISDKSISRYHFEIEYDGQNYLLIDKSRNGTFVNSLNKKVEGNYILEDGDKIYIGHFEKYLVEIIFLRGTNSSQRKRFDLGQFPFGHKVITIGRSTNNSLCLEHPFVSAEHALAILTENGYQIRDLRSKYGTFVNDKRVTEVEPLLWKEEDLVKIGPFTLAMAEQTIKLMYNY
jgi:pSer/pThr/pTyr-binding forkhead associated (FHA) protein